MISRSEDNIGQRRVLVIIVSDTQSRVVCRRAIGNQWVTNTIGQGNNDWVLTWIRQNNFKQTINAVWELLRFRTNKAFTSVLKLHNRDFGHVVIDNRCCDRRATSDFVLCRSCYIIELRIRDRNLELFVRFNEIRKVSQAAISLRDSIILKRVQFDIERWRGVPNAGAAVAIPSNGCAIKLKTSRCTCCRCRGS